MGGSRCSRKTQALWLPFRRIEGSIVGTFPSLISTCRPTLGGFACYLHMFA